MRFRTFPFLAVLISLLPGCAWLPVEPAHNLSLSDLPPVEQGKYKVDAYIQAAEQLQAAGRIGASRQLIALARSGALSAEPRRDHANLVADEKKIAVLCRMLFVPREGASFDRPALGAPEFLGDPPGAAVALNNTSNSPGFQTWPLEPIELVDDIPFLVVGRYPVDAAVDPRNSETYVDYCLTNCAWTRVRFSEKTAEQKSEALTKLLASLKWRQALKPSERDWLSAQLQ